MSTSESSDDENLERLREAACTEFLNDSMFSSTNCKDGNINGSKEEIHYPPSLRLNVNKDDQFNCFNVTPQFQQHIAKKLSEILDKKLEKLLTTKAINVNQRYKKSGIKLFRNSKKCIKLIKHQDRNLKRVKCINYSDSSDNEVKCREVAVNSLDILSKKEVANWSSRTKGEVFRYKSSKSGVLVSLD